MDAPALSSPHNDIPEFSSCPNTDYGHAKQDFIAPHIIKNATMCAVSVNPTYQRVKPRQPKTGFQTVFLLAAALKSRKFPPQQKRSRALVPKTSFTWPSVP
jgi:hypothetical protein